MAYGLPRKNTVKNLLGHSCFDVQEHWDLALLTKTWYTNLANIRLPFLEEIAFGNSVHLKPYATSKKSLLPSVESIQMERKHEMKRLEDLKHQKNRAQEIPFALRDRPVGLRRPLPPK
ncbi:uncharacterized protein C4orf36 homolog [Tenrec ecaudatus]|uniref:uncharacterized protein C4orf36 homolog n=1 Tax=Tenrec ecaudatus TaxID=94439 RepID=UPI003F5A4896